VGRGRQLQGHHRPAGSVALEAPGPGGLVASGARGNPAPDVPGHRGGVQIFDEERAEAEATKSVVVSGQISDTIEGREVRLEIDGPKIDDSQRKLTARLIKDGDKGTQNRACYVTWDTKSHCPGED
jgi:hypothetical protein